MIHAIIMAGGAGTRFWPESRTLTPKQLLRLVDDRTMIQSTVARLGKLTSPERTLIITNAKLASAIREQLPQLPASSVIGEPCKRDTAPCIGLAATLVAASDPEGTMVVMPSDHVIRTDEQFQAALAAAADLVERSPDLLVTFGIRPTYPAESFGYIEQGPALAGSSVAHRVVRFREKPKTEQAEAFLAKGNFLWNSGIFVWKARTILELLKQFQPELYAHCETIGRALGTPDYEAVLEREFSAMKPISVDYAVMEKAPQVAVMAASFQWDDVGSWQSITRLQPNDASGNTIQGRHLGVRTSGSIVRTTDEHLVVTLGLKDCIVVHTPDATLVANKHDEEAIREVVKQLQERGWTEYL